MEDEIITLKSTINANDYSPAHTTSSEEVLRDGAGDIEGSPESLRIRRLMMGPGTGGGQRKPSSPVRNPIDQPLVIETTGLTYDQVRMIPRGECEVLLVHCIKYP